jgi:hypothetical protein
MDNADFVKWANENIVFLVAHSDPGHEEVEEEDAKGEKHKVCSLYPGLTCAQHQEADRDAQNPAEGMPKIPRQNGVPNSWFVSPSGEVKQVEGADQQSAGKTQEIGEVWQKEIGDHVAWKKWEKYQEAFAEGDAALEQADWKKALASYAVVEKVGKKGTEALTKQTAAKLETLNERVAAAFAELRDGEADAKAKQKSVRDLLGKVSLRLTSGYLPVRDEIDAWLKAQPK